MQKNHVLTNKVYKFYSMTILRVCTKRILHDLDIVNHSTL